jgi:riboflavin transporter FmnP
MNTRAIAATVVLAAITITLNPGFTGLAVPAPFFPWVTYYLWEIPVVVACFLVGPKHAVLITVLNLIILLAIAPGFAIQQPFYQCTAAITMLGGIYLAIRISNRKPSQQKAVPKRRLLLFSTAFGILFRVGIMAVVAYVFFRYPVVGFELPEPLILLMIPLIALYDATFALYTIPIGYFIAKTVQKRENGQQI